MFESSALRVCGEVRVPDAARSRLDRGGPHSLFKFVRQLVDVGGVYTSAVYD